VALRPIPDLDSDMSIRTTQSIVSFSQQFWFHGLDAPQPPGAYRVDDEEEPIDGLSWLAYRRVATFLFLPAIGSENAVQQMVKVERVDLDAAEQWDRARQITIES
jgi:hypothetical protein